MTFPISNLRLLTQPGCLLGSAEYNGSITVNQVTKTVTEERNHLTTEGDAVALDVTVQCLLDLDQPTAHVVLQDEFQDDQNSCGNGVLDILNCNWVNVEVVL